MLFMMIILGGLTRLTGSGLSMVHWQPLTFTPPLSAEAWEEEFNHYKGSPEYKEKNSHMQLADFKKIYWVEFLHRSFGRLIGIVWFFPLIFFWIKRKQNGLSTKFLNWCTLLGVLGGFQGALGWYMVKSGLVENHPWVSHIRLSFHLCLAVIIIALSTILFLSVWAPKTNDETHKPSTKLAWLTLVAIYLQIASGGLVAGLQAGIFFKPLMKTLSIIWVSDLGLSNFIENGAMVMFVHLIWACVVSVLVLILFVQSLLKKFCRKSSIIMFILLLAQLKLGVFTAMKYANKPIALASLHQATGILLFIAALCYLYFLKNRPVPKAIS